VGVALITAPPGKKNRGRNNRSPHLKETYFKGSPRRRGNKRKQKEKPKTGSLCSLDMLGGAEKKGRRKGGFERSGFVGEV